MPSPDSPNNVADVPLYNSRLINNYVEYAKKFYPELDTDSILGCAGIKTYEVEDPGHWLSQHQIDSFHKTLIQKTGNIRISREVGRYAASTQASGTLRQYALGFLTPTSAYGMFETLASKLGCAHTFKTKKIARNKVEITVTVAPGVNENPHQCENRIGLFEAMAKLFTNKFAKIEIYNQSSSSHNEEISLIMIRSQSWLKLEIKFEKSLERC